MGLRDPKAEATRLEEAKRAIKRLKLKRQERSRRRSSNDNVAVSEACDGLLSHGHDTSVSPHTQAQAEKRDDVRKPARHRSRSVTDIPRAVVMHQGPPRSELLRGKDDLSEWKSPAILPLLKGTKTYSRLREESLPPSSLAPLDTKIVKLRPDSPKPAPYHSLFELIAMRDEPSYSELQLPLKAAIKKGGNRLPEVQESEDAGSSSFEAKIQSSENQESRLMDKSFGNTDHISPSVPLKCNTKNIMSVKSALSDFESRDDTNEACSSKAPTKDSLSSNKKNYSAVGNDNEATDVKTGRVSIKVPLKTKVIKKKKFKTVKKTAHTLKEPHVPLSVTMSSSNFKVPVFTISSDDTNNDCESESESTLKNFADKSTKGKFQVTTVSESVLPVQVEGDEGEEFSDVNEEDFEDLTSPETIEELASKRPALFKNDRSSIEFHFLDGNVVLHLKHPASFVFCGQLQIQVLKGAVEILGFQLTPSRAIQTVFCPRGSSLLPVQTVINEDQDPSNFVFESSLISGVLEKGSLGDAFLLLKKAENALPFVLEQYTSFKLFPQLSGSGITDTFWKAGQKLQCVCNPVPGCNIFLKGDRWDEISEHIQQQDGCTVLCGGKGVGKSTMLRFLVNQYLSSGREEVLLIDLDPGQSEMTVPGCLSLSLIQKPLLGPNFTHIQSPDKCVYVGDINVSNCVSRYMDACVTLLNHWQSTEKFRSIPCLVNTMGFNKGLGVTLMVQILSILQPASVVQIQSESKKSNYPELLSIDYVKRNCSLSPFKLKLDNQLMSQGRILSSTNSISYDLHVVKSASNSQTKHDQTIGIAPKLSREIVILSYFSKVACSPKYSLLDVVPYSCPLDALYISVCHESVPPPIMLSVFNANLVALCCVNPKDEDIVKPSVPGLPSVVTKLPTTDCLGFGIVRGIDMDSKELFLLTPVSPSVLIDVNCLVVGAINLPDGVLLTPPREPGPVPYVVVTENKQSARPFKRSFRVNRKAPNF